MVTVGEIISLDKFNQFRLLAGKNGLDNIVVRAGIIDYESPQDLLESNIRDEMLLSNLPMIKGKPEKIVEYIKALIESGTACFAIKTTLFKEIPQEAIEIANKFNYPLFLFDDYYLDELDCEFAQSLLGKSSLVLPTNDGCLIIFSSEKDCINKHIVIQKLGLQPKNYHIGVSLQTNDHGQLGNLLYESEIALHYARFKEMFISGFEDLGIYQLLIPLSQEGKLPQFYRNIVHKIIDYDKKHSSELLKTALREPFTIDCKRFWYFLTIHCKNRKLRLNFL